MKKRQVVCGGLLLFVACQGESPVVGESRDEPLVEGQGPSESGTTNQFVEQVRISEDVAQCLPRVLALQNGAPECVLAEVIPGGAEEPDCSCDQPGRRPLSSRMNEIVLAQLPANGFCNVEETCTNACACEIVPASGEEREACENDVDAEGANGWCYIAPAQGLGNPELVSQCPATQQRRLRLLGDAEKTEEGIVYLACQTTERLASPSGLGEVCVPSDEYSPTWSSFGVTEINVETGSPACQSGVCLINHFQGRVTCPYGQSEEQALSDPACFVPGNYEPVQVPVEPQLQGRQAEASSICSCRCDGPGPGPFCECPESMSCEPVFQDFGFDGQVDVAGSYCIPKGTEFDSTQLGGPVCDWSLENCEGELEE